MMLHLLFMLLKQHICYVFPAIITIPVQGRTPEHAGSPHARENPAAQPSRRKGEAPGFPGEHAHVHARARLGPWARPATAMGEHCGLLTRVTGTLNTHGAATRTCSSFSRLPWDGGADVCPSREA